MDYLTFQHCQNRCRIRFSLLSCRKQEEYRIAKGEEERDLYATEKKKSFESLEKSDSESSLIQSKRRLHRRKYASYRTRNNIEQLESSDEERDNSFGFIEQVISEFCIELEFLNK